MRVASGAKREGAAPVEPGTVPSSGDDARAILAALERIERRLDRVEASAARAATEGAAARATITDTCDPRPRTSRPGGT